MKLDVIAVSAEAVPLRELYRQEMNCQIIHDSWNQRGWTDSYLLHLENHVVGYGSVGGVRGKRKNIVTEFYILPVHRGAALRLFHRFLTISGARKIETQTNDLLLTHMLYDCARRIKCEAILFHDALATNLTVPQVVFRRSTQADQGEVFPHKIEPVGDWVLEANGQIVATGGILFHYNIPYGDLYMEVAEPHRRHGYGSFLIQELKRVCYEMGKIPAARCSVRNGASRATLQKAGMLPCGRLLTGVVLSELPALS